MQSTAIIPRVGIGALRFGQARSEVEKLLGTPDALDRDILGREIWKYNALDLDASFDNDADWRLVHLSVEHPRYTLRGYSIIGLSITHFVTTATSIGLGALELDPDSLDANPTYCFPKCEVCVSSFDGLVCSIDWSVVINDRDDYLWPPSVVAA